MLQDVAARCVPDIHGRRKEISEDFITLYLYISAPEFYKATTVI